MDRKLLYGLKTVGRLLMMLKLQQFLQTLKMVMVMEKTNGMASWMVLHTSGKTAKVGLLQVSFAKSWILLYLFVEVSRQQMNADHYQLD